MALMMGALASFVVPKDAGDVRLRVLYEGEGQH
jgi:hypothetical protein